MNTCSNVIIIQCITECHYTIEYKLSFYRYKIGLNLFDLKYILQRCIPTSLSTEKQFHVHCVHTLILETIKFLFKDLKLTKLIYVHYVLQLDEFSFYYNYYNYCIMYIYNVYLYVYERDHTVNSRIPH